MAPKLEGVGLSARTLVNFNKAEGRKCSFWFIKASKLRAFTGTTPPRLQDIRSWPDHRDWLEQKTIDFNKGVCKS